MKRSETLRHFPETGKRVEMGVAIFYKQGRERKRRETLSRNREEREDEGDTF